MKLTAGVLYHWQHCSEAAAVASCHHWAHCNKHDIIHKSTVNITYYNVTRAGSSHCQHAEKTWWCLNEWFLRYECEERCKSRLTNWPTQSSQHFKLRPWWSNDVSNGLNWLLIPQVTDCWLQQQLQKCHITESTWSTWITSHWWWDKLIATDRQLTDVNLCRVHIKTKLKTANEKLESKLKQKTMKHKHTEYTVAQQKHWST